MANEADPFAFLRSLAPSPGGDPADSLGGAIPATDAELFAGSEPVAPPPVSPVVPAISDPAPVVVPITAGAVPGDIGTIYQAAIVRLDARVRALEQLATQNGWVL